MRFDIPNEIELDVGYEFRTYINIGKQRRLEKEKPFLYSTRIELRKINNIEENKYKNIDSFSEWKKYIYEKYNKRRNFNLEDCLFYVEKSKRNMQIACDQLGVIVTPIYVVMLTMGVTLFGNTEFINGDPDIINMRNAIVKYLIEGYISMTVILLGVLLFLLIYYYRRKRRIYFLQDLIRVLKKGVD